MLFKAMVGALSLVAAVLAVPQVAGAASNTRDVNKLIAGSESIDLSTATPVYSFPATGFELDTSYNHGILTFHMQVFQECAYNPTEDWHVQTLGFLFGITDAANDTFVRFPEGVGRFDGKSNIKQLSNIGKGPNLYTVFIDGKTYYHYDTCDWSSDTDFNKDACGRCESYAWTKGDLTCNKDAAGVYRFQETNCFFKA